MGRIMPSKLHRVKTFESVEWLYPEGGGFRRGAESDDILEVQIDSWVTDTQSMLISVGPLSVVRVTADPTIQDPTIHIMENMPVMMTRTLAIVYAPAIEQGEEDVEDVDEVGGSLDAAGAASAPRISDGNFGGGSGDGLRLPDIP